jgi:thiol-disulfide isomerase/thioredoxin
MSMAATPSQMTGLGTKASQFSLADVLTGQKTTLEDFNDKQALLVMFICKHCPYVLHVKPALIELARDYAEHSLAIVSISSNDASRYPEDAPERLATMAVEFPFPLLFDETQAVAKAYGAACTPDFFLFDADRNLVYRGQLDDSRPGNNRPLTGRDLRKAIDAVLSGKPVDPDQRASIGCNIKWKPGNEPEYA